MRPLAGKRVLVTRAREQEHSLATLLTDAGAVPVVVPTIVIAPPTDPAPLKEALGKLRAGGYDWVAFTSANAVDRTWKAWVEAGGTGKETPRIQVAVVGPATAAALEAHGVTVDVQARELRGEGLAAELLRVAGKPGRLLLPRAAKARDALPDALRQAGWQVDVVTAYETHPTPPETAVALAAELDAGAVDVVTFTSSSTVEHLCDLLAPRAVDRLAHPVVASIGPLTTETALARGLRVDVTARESTIGGLVQDLEEYIGSL